MRPTLHARGHDADRLQASMLRVLAGNPLLSMATRSEAGAVHISTSFFSYHSEELILHFLSHPDSVHCHNLRTVPQMAVAVFDSRQPWGSPHSGLQLFGTGALTPEHAIPAVQALYSARFPRYGELLQRASADARVGPTFQALRFYSFVPDRVQILDEWEFGDEVFITASVLR
ncbi:MAG TPA: pyridoxamine 5'-phosphate oxidase family protein [Gemmatimonadales bacterium]|nr:pyridoxamine 5'-phosphate oxidase family protein [Gemmatimonadales bacterium]